VQRKSIWAAAIASVLLVLAAGFSYLYADHSPQPKPQETVSETPIRNPTVEAPPEEASTTRVQAIALQSLDAPIELDATLDFGEGRTLNALLVDEVAGPPLLAVGERLLDRFDELLALANRGDALAARTLFEHTEDCETLLRLEPSKAAALNRLETSAVILTPFGETSIPPDQHEGFRRTIEMDYQTCDGASDMSRRLPASERERLVKEAAKSDLVAGRYYLRRYVEDGARRLEALEELWEAGYAEYLQEIGRTQLRLADSMGMSEEDAYIADYAYFKAFAVVMGSGWSQGDNRVFARGVAASQASLEMRAARLSATQQARGDQMAFEIVQGNPNCCRAVFGFQQQGLE